MNYRLTPKARDDLREAAFYYEEQRGGLGAEFLIEVGLALSRVFDGPQRWPQEAPGVYKYRLDRFPYALLYEVPSPKQIHVIAVFDLRRRPGSWRG